MRLRRHRPEYQGVEYTREEALELGLCSRTLELLEICECSNCTSRRSRAYWAQEEVKRVENEKAYEEAMAKRLGTSELIQQNESLRAARELAHNTQTELERARITSEQAQTRAYLQDQIDKRTQQDLERANQMSRIKDFFSKRNK